MLPGEMVILMAIGINKNTGKNLLSRPMDVTGEYIGYLYGSLVNRGYLKGHRSTGFQLTTLGRETIQEFMKKNESRARDIAKRLQYLGIDIGPEREQKITKMEREAIK